MTSFGNNQNKSERVQFSQISNAHPTPMNAPKSFDAITMVFHWVTVVFVIGLLATALLHAQSHANPAKMFLLWIHRSLGIAVWLVTVFRIAWRMNGAQMPPFPATVTGTHRALVQISEYSLYALLVIQPITGLTATITRGRGFDLFWSYIPPLMGHYPALHADLFIAHRLGAWILIIFISGHALVALVHHFILRDNVLLRMIPLGAMQRRTRKFVVGTNNPQASFEV
jgi:superoxide oxidase